MCTVPCFWLRCLVYICSADRPDAMRWVAHRRCSISGADRAATDTANACSQCWKLHCPTAAGRAAARILELRDDGETCVVVTIDLRFLSGLMPSYGTSRGR